MFLADRFRPPQSIQLLRLLFMGAALALSVELARRSISLYFPRDWSAAHEGDALADWKGARLFIRGKNPYSAEGLAMMGQGSMGHPPTTAFWYLPLAEFEKSVAAQLSTVLLFALLPLHTFLCSKELRYPAPLATALLVSTAVTTTSWFHYHFEVVQFSEPIAFLYVVSWWHLRRNKDAVAGMCIGAALTIKLFPGLLLILLLAARRFRALLAATGTYLAIALVMTRGYGLRSWLDFFKRQDGIAHDWLGSPQNSSLPGLVVRLLNPGCQGPGYPSLRATLISLACSLLLVGLAGWSSLARFKQARAGDARALDLPFALFALLSVFLNAWAWEHYFVLVIQPLFILLAAFCGTGRTVLRRWVEHDYSTQRLVFLSLLSLLGITGVLLTVRALNVEIHERDAMARLWFQYRDPFYHWHFHLLEGANFAVWIVPILLCFSALALTRHVGRTGPPKLEVVPKGDH